MLNREGAEVQVAKLVQVLIPEWIVSCLGATVASRATALSGRTAILARPVLWRSGRYSQSSGSSARRSLEWDRHLSCG